MASVSGRRISMREPLPGVGGQGDLAAQLADLRAHRVHADAAAGHVAHLLGGREAGREDELARPGRVDRVDLARLDEAALGGLAGDAGGVDAPAVVRHADDDAAAGVAGGDLQAAALRLARRDALLRRLEAVVERVADEVHERVADGVDDGAVELGVLAQRARGRPPCPGGRRGRGRGAGSGRKTASTGIMRTCMTMCWSACEQRVSSCIACASPGTSAWPASASTWVRWTTSSAMWCMSSSRRSASTRTVPDGLRSSRGRPRRPSAASVGAPRRRRRRARARRLLRRVVHADDERLGDVGHLRDRGLQRLGILGLDPRPRRRSRRSRRPRPRRGRRRRAGRGRRRRAMTMKARTDGMSASAPRRATTCTTPSGCAGTGGALRATAAGAAWSSASLRMRPWQACDERARVEPLGALDLDVVDGGLERVHAAEQDVDRVAAQPLAALAQQLEDVLHVVREGRDLRRSPSSRSSP